MGSRKGIPNKDYDVVDVYPPGCPRCGTTKSKVLPVRQLQRNISGLSSSGQVLDLVVLKTVKCTKCEHVYKKRSWEKQRPKTEKRGIKATHSLNGRAGKPEHS